MTSIFHSSSTNRFLRARARVTSQPKVGRRRTPKRRAVNPKSWLVNRRLGLWMWTAGLLRTKSWRPPSSRSPVRARFIGQPKVESCGLVIFFFHRRWGWWGVRLKKKIRPSVTNPQLPGTHHQLWITSPHLRWTDVEKWLVIRLRRQSCWWKPGNCRLKTN